MLLVLRVLLGLCLFEAKALTPDLKARIDETLKKAKNAGLTLESAHKCSKDCIKKQGGSLQDFIDQGIAHQLVKNPFNQGAQNVKTNTHRRDKRPYDDQETPKNKNDQDQEQRIIFISENIPLATLKVYGEFAQKHHSRLVLQGMIQNSMLKTAAFSESIGAPVDIDPKLFQIYHIQRVPVFLYKKGNRGLMMRGHIKSPHIFEEMKIHLLQEEQNRRHKGKVA